jgi:hypothetical protein
MPVVATPSRDGLDSCHGSSCTNLADYFAGSLIRSPYNVL